MGWKYDFRTEPLECVELAARRNPEFRLYMAVGLFDLVTTPGYARALENQLDMPLERIVRREYTSGHMPYLGEESIKAMTADMRDFITGKIV